MGWLGIGCCAYQMLMRGVRRHHAHDVPLGSAFAFECLSVLIFISSMTFVQRMKKTLARSSFQWAFAGTLVQLALFTWTCVEDRSTMGRRRPVIHSDQLPLGGLFFIMAWAFDRYMMSMITRASNRLTINKES